MSVAQYPPDIIDSVHTMLAVLQILLSNKPKFCAVPAEKEGEVSNGKGVKGSKEPSFSSPSFLSLCNQIGVKQVRYERFLTSHFVPFLEALVSSFLQNFCFST